MELISKDYIHFIDVETTGFDVWRNSLISFSSIIAKADTLEFVDQYSGYSKPESKKQYGEEAEKIHGITYEEAMEFPDPRDACIGWLNFLVPYKHPDNYPMVTVFHANGRFDLRWANSLFFKTKMYYSWLKVSRLEHTESTIKLAKSHLDLPNYKLNTVCEKLGIELDHHNAASDTKGCYEIYKQLKPMEI